VGGLKKSDESLFVRDLLFIGARVDERVSDVNSSICGRTLLPYIIRVAKGHGRSRRRP
jgi:hypothetical protein